MGLSSARVPPTATSSENHPVLLASATRLACTTFLEPLDLTSSTRAKTLWFHLREIFPNSATSTPEKLRKQNSSRKPWANCAAGHAPSANVLRDDARDCVLSRTPLGVELWVRNKNGPERPVFASILAETEGFEPSMQLITAYSLSRGAPSASRSRLRKLLIVAGFIFPATALPTMQPPCRAQTHDAARARPAPCICRQSPRKS